MSNNGSAARLREENDTVLEFAVARESANRPLKECAAIALKRYFQDLEGETPANLYTLVINEVEEPLLRAVLEFTRGNQSRASEILGINRSTLRKKLRLHGLHH